MRLRRRSLLPMLALGLCFVSTCASAGVGTALQKRAFAAWQERCKSAGEFIYKPADKVEGIYLITWPTTVNFDDQFRLDDPYGSDSIKDEYLLNFLQGFYHVPPQAPSVGHPPRIGFHWVEARDFRDGQLYRYTGRIEEPWQTNKSFLQGYKRLVYDKVPIQAVSARYGIQSSDISTRADRELWIAGGSLKVIDLRTQEVVGERIGYMFDWAQGSRANQRSPWLLAANNACPDFHRNYPSPIPGGGAPAQPSQTLQFVERVLRPAR
jgi:hypothetical protein